MRTYRTFNQEPHPGDLRERIRIGRTVSTENENGYPEETDETVCTVWAGIDDAGGSQQNTDALQTVVCTHNFVIRHRTDIEIGMWVEYEDKRYDIVHVDHYSFMKRYLNLRTKMREGVSK